MRILKNFQTYSNIIEDLQKHRTENIKNPIIKDVHHKTKNSEKGRTMWSQFIEDRYGDIFRNYEEQHQRDQEQIQQSLEQNKVYQEQNKVYQEQNKEYQEQLRKAQEKIEKYENFIKENGLNLDSEK